MQFKYKVQLTYKDAAVTTVMPKDIVMGMTMDMDIEVNVVVGRVIETDTVMVMITDMVADMVTAEVVITEVVIMEVGITKVGITEVVDMDTRVKDTIQEGHQVVQVVAATMTIIEQSNKIN